MTVLATLICLPLLVVFYLYYVAGLTHRKSEALQRYLYDTHAGGILNILESPGHAQTMKKMDWLWRRDFSGGFMRDVMPKLFREAQTATLAARRFPALWHFGFFCLAYGMVWAKVRVWAEVEDLRYLLGTEASVLRAARASG